MKNRELARLLDKAGLHVHAGYPQPDAIEKFAELIIKEAMQIVKDEVVYPSDWDTADDAIQRVNEHFGVK
jgi:hypothetical protein